MRQIDILHYNNGLALAAQIDLEVRRRTRGNPDERRRICAAVTYVEGRQQPLRNTGATTCAVILAQLYSAHASVILVAPNRFASHQEHGRVASSHRNITRVYPELAVTGMRADIIIVDAHFAVVRATNQRWLADLELALRPGGTIIQLQ
ncbi:hypothetical protein Axy23_027 [Achromobacter phage vB_AxyP_19-32_Axy23]|uniref:Uncharacterized protein n=1 Tax=Achromobacter phage vB_AxyP_19-32_Axy23 TaxID=2591047 RepID=A0A514CW48_9CAUD|nr:hypothetical protein Axy23_027 [Achromobacter phage vB_AxyP_19-32_Axy23]